VLGGLADREALEDRTHLQDLDGLLVANAPDTRAAMELANDEPVLLETDERGAHGATRHVERRRDVRLDQPRIGGDIAANDGLAEGVVARSDRHRAHAYCTNVAKIVNNSVYMSPVEQRVPAVAVLGLGEAGRRLASDLVALGVEVRGYDPLTVTAPEGVTRASDPVSAMSGATTVLALTTGATALAAAESALPGLRTGVIYVDLSTASPSLKVDIAALVAGAGARFADAALLGPVPARGLATPALASGPGAQAFADAFGPLGMPVEVVSDVPGDAASLKLLRSVFMKGLAASALESLQAAKAAGHAEWLGREIAAVIGDPLLERLTEGSRRHAVRRVDELHAARDLLLELGVEPRVTVASTAVLGELASTAASDRGGHGMPA